MMGRLNGCAFRLRQELIACNHAHARRMGLAYVTSHGELPVVVYQPSECGQYHGNFMAPSYRAILKNSGWRRRLEKVHAQARRSLPGSERRWRELDSSLSSDALLMNIFCYPRITKSISVEDTFEQDVLLQETEPMIRRLAEKLWSASRKERRTPRTIVLKLKTSEFKILTRSYTPSSPLSSCEELVEIALRLRERVQASPQQRYRLVGVGLSNFREAQDAAAQPALFDGVD
jgi:impB/mucB/samB family C-terminal domain